MRIEPAEVGSRKRGGTPWREGQMRVHRERAKQEGVVCGQRSMLGGAPDSRAVVIAKTNIGRETNIGPYLTKRCQGGIGTHMGPAMPMARGIGSRFYSQTWCCW